MAISASNAALLKPPFRKVRKVWYRFIEIVEELMKVDPQLREADATVELIRRKALTNEMISETKSPFAVTVSVLCDLRLMCWSFHKEKLGIRLERPVSELAPELERERIRRMQLVNRNAQLIRDSVRTFIRGLERKRIGPEGWVSIFSLMRDGRELAAKLRQIRKLKTVLQQIDSLRSIIRPYLQVVSEGEMCQHTGLALMDIWRYFRHTWVTEYQTVPGRNLMILIRDAAAQHHPVIGIAALASPVVHLTLRDEWIGWAPQQFVRSLQDNPTAAWAKWTKQKLEQLIQDIYVDDLIHDRLITRAKIVSPDEQVIATLEEEAENARKQHQLHPTKSIHKNPTKTIDDKAWLIRTETHLFRFKRCATLANLLRARLRLKHAGFIQPTKEALAKALATSEGRQAIETIRKQIKAIHIGNDVLDISVCGAVAPYSDILGGKLVAMMLTSPEFVQSYTNKYGRTNSIIASSMAGRRVSRRPRLTLLTTTSLYGAELNQYTRLRIPASEVGGEPQHEVAYKKLGLTRGQGSYHFSAVTVDLIESLLSQLSHNRSVNSIFGEGVSPRLRKIRAGLDICGFPTDEVLTHGSPRIAYGVSLTSNHRDYLLERAKQPLYLLPQQPAAEVSRLIADYWTRRWLLNRVLRTEILERVEQHTLVSPVMHGARVTLPWLLEEEPLFSNVHPS